MKSDSCSREKPCISSLAQRIVCGFVVAICLLGAMPCAASLTTNIVDLAALAACGSGTTNGWAVSSLTNYTSANAPFNPNIRLKAGASYAKSPDLGGYIRRVEFDYRSSPTEGKRLLVADEKGALLHTCEYTNLPSEGAFTNCVVEIANPNVRGIIFKYDNGGIQTTWSLANLKIITESDLTAVTNGAAMRLEWYNGSDVVSNRVDIFRVKQVSRGETNVVDRYDFSLLKTDYAYRESADTISIIFNGRLYGSTLYLAKDKPGILQISNSGTHGVLLIKCPEKNIYSHLRIAVCRPDNETKEAFPLSWVQDTITNTFASITLTDAFVTNYIPLNAALGKDWLCLNAVDKQSGPRILVSDIAFVTIKEPAYNSTNVYSKIVENAAFLDVKDLMPRRAHYFTVTTFTTDGSSTVSEPSEWFYPTLPPGLLFMVR